MPPDGYTTVTITELTAHIDVLGSMGDAVEHSVDLALSEQEAITNADLARLLYERLSDE